MDSRSLFARSDTRWRTVGWIKPAHGAHAMNERELFIAALQTEDTRQRLAYLREACGPNPALLERVEGLLRVYEGAGTFLESGVADPIPTVDQSLFCERPGTLVGPYKLLQEIGEGGMGAVF